MKCVVIGKVLAPLTADGTIEPHALMRAHLPSPDAPRGLRQCPLLGRFVLARGVAPGFCHPHAHLLQLQEQEEAQEPGTGSPRPLAVL